MQKPLTKPKATSDKVKYIKSSVQQWSDRTHADNGEHQSFSDDEHENEHDVFSVHEEKHTLLRSKSCPAASPTAVNPDEFNF